nr:phosphotransferase [Bacillus pakistanensis]
MKLVQRLAESSNRIPSKGPFLLHGDCGVHNFVFKGGSLSGVIDPTPVLGEPLYDLLYAFCSITE